MSVVSGATALMASEDMMNAKRRAISLPNIFKASERAIQCMRGRIIKISKIIQYNIWVRENEDLTDDM